MLTMMGVIFCVSLVLGIPVAFVLGLAAYVPILIEGGVPSFVVVQRIIFGLDNFPLLAIPFFILAGELMLECGIAEKLVNFQRLLVGHVRGGLAHVNVMASILFAGISGSALADAAGLGKIEMRIMQEGGYDLEFSAAVTAASATIGPIIPPSIIMVIYAVVEQRVSIGGLFMTGVVPGLLIGFMLMVVCYVISRRRNYPVTKMRASLFEILKGAADAIVALVMPAIIIGGILGGVFTATEAGAVAVVYASVVGFFVLRTLKVKAIPGILVRTGITTASVLLIIGMAGGVTWLLATQQVPQRLAAFYMHFSQEPWFFLLFVNACLIIIGMVMDITAAMLIFVPIFSPIAISLGIEPLHFAIIVVMNLYIGTITPPLGIVVFVVSSVGGLKVEPVFRSVFPFLAALIISLLIVTFWPTISLTLPGLLGYLK
jgi:C4-dicarboxylate transporter DctM subunit